MGTSSTMFLPSSVFISISLGERCMICRFSVDNRIDSLMLPRLFATTTCLSVRTSSLCNFENFLRLVAGDLKVTSSSCNTFKLVVVDVMLVVFLFLFSCTRIPNTTLQMSDVDRHKFGLQARENWRRIFPNYSNSYIRTISSGNKLATRVNVLCNDKL